MIFVNGRVIKRCRCPLLVWPPGRQGDPDDLGINGVGMPELTPRWHDFGFRPLTAKEMEPSRSDILRFAGYHGGKFGLTVAHTVGKVG